jgi:tetratricopeptide (TPR) repeat protein
MDSSYSWAYYDRGLAYRMTGQWERALADFNKAVAVDPNYSGIYYHRGVAHSRLGHRVQENEDMKRAVHLGNKDAQKWLRERKGNG